MKQKGHLSLLAALLLGSLSCAAAWGLPAAETGSSVRDVRGFEAVELTIGGELILTQGDRESLEIEASPSDLARITTAVRGGTLIIAQVNPGPGPRGPVTYRLTMKRIAGLATRSQGSIRAAAIETDALRIQISSSGPVSVDRLAARRLDVNISSRGDCTVAGAVDGLRIQISSSGSYRGEDLASREASVQSSSSGTATVRVSERLDVNISSSGNVRYRGNPRITSRVSSSGGLVALD
jgi:hypothetical protein